jgi:ADP-L-glycero-D-manno-heptose 6-epimerase
MHKNAQIVVTGAAGFIASCLVAYLNQQGYKNLILVDDFVRIDKQANFYDKQFTTKVERLAFFDWLETNSPTINFIFHLGARTDTTEFDYAIHEALNLQYTQQLWNYCAKKGVPLVYASSAATYGDGALGYEDNHELPFTLQPLNPYGLSKNEFDKWALQQKATPPFWAGLKFFNVYGPNEYHKGRMASVIWHAWQQIKATGRVTLFKSHRADFKDGQQLRDFIYVKDIVQVCYWLMKAPPASAIYNVGTGNARTFEDLAKATFAALNITPTIEYIDMPIDLREKYQYFTEANMTKLKTAGYPYPFTSLEEGVADYVHRFLLTEKASYR